MPAYHSTYNEEENVRQIASISILPLNTKSRGPAPAPEEAIDLFRANSLFRNFEIKGGADRLLIYLILFISDCLSRISASNPTWNKNEATKHLLSHAVDNFALPGDANFPLSSLYSSPASRVDADTLRHYLQQARQELVGRLVDKIYQDQTPSPWWLAFTKRKFMGRSLS